MTSLWYFQSDLVTDIHGGWDEGFTNIMAQSPTGSGKTIIAANVARDIIDAGHHVVAAAHRAELLEQTVEKFHTLNVRAKQIGHGTGAQGNLHHVSVITLSQF